MKRVREHNESASHYVENLPRDCLACVIAHLDFTTLFRAKQVSKQWKAAVEAFLRMDGSIFDEAWLRLAAELNWRHVECRVVLKNPWASIFYNVYSFYKLDGTETMITCRCCGSKLTERKSIWTTQIDTRNGYAESYESFGSVFLCDRAKCLFNRMIMCVFDMCMCSFTMTCDHKHHFKYCIPELLY